MHLGADYRMAGEIMLSNDHRTETVEILAMEHADPEEQGAVIHLRNISGQPTITLDADYGDDDLGRIEVEGRVVTCELEITGGCDIAEPFSTSGGESLPPGTLVVIDEENPGRLRMSTRPYDRRVAGIISGAGGINPGLTLRQKGALEGEELVALSGRVYCRAETSAGPIRPGDLLTTSAVPGHAMKAADPTKAQGSVIGKAMTSLDAGSGLVLVLVSLQ